MRHRYLIILMILPVWIMVTFMAGCEYDAPNKIWDAGSKIGTPPKITAIEPADVAYAGIREIKIIGEGFSPDAALNKVYFDKYQPIVKSATSNEIIIYRPNLIKDSIQVKLSVRDAFEVAELDELYEVEQVISQYGEFDDIQNNFYGLALDRDDNLYIGSRKLVYKLTPSGERTEFGTYSYSKIYDMKMGPDGYLYFTPGRKQIDRIGPEGGGSSRWVQTPSTVNYFDFDQNRNIFAARKDGVIAIDPNGAVQQVGQYDNFNVSCMRVFGNDLYISGEYSGDDSNIPPTGIWKSAILDNAGTLGNVELVLDWGDAGEFADYTISWFTFSEDGELYISINDHDLYSILIYSNGNVEPLYYDTDVLVPVADYIVWGNGNELYLNRGKTMTSLVADPVTRIYKVGMGKPGASYYGRN